ncbi:CRISPR-associated protein Csx20 [Thermoflavimicrobium daqui]|uniref:CRISPR-associated protein n=1 Tax=Thermoflavimicrobium daqui TaxID=2137476 RepID=A0A364K5N7_9BACL|nr:CRISPR-associated protein Csx20 [Thermoflavimicrobium daqui]RAL25614.1 hypothetical protein DL897_05925 [Thermoflavimicrobium daqui]
MRKMVLLVSHPLLAEQKQEAQRVWQVKSFVALPEQLQNVWSQITPEGSFPMDPFRSLLNWLEKETEPQDLVWVQGEPGALFLVVSWCFQYERIPVYATTRREHQSTMLPDGTVRNQHTFKHVTFRVYPRGDEIEFFPT